MTEILLYIALGVAAGIFGGLFGLGGGILLIPALVILFGMSQHEAQGTTLALLLPPIGLLAALTYYKQGYVNVKMAAFICIGFFFGGLLGAKFAVGIPDPLLKKLFGVLLLVAAADMIFRK